MSGGILQCMNLNISQYYRNPILSAVYPNYPKSHYKKLGMLFITVPYYLCASLENTITFCSRNTSIGGKKVRPSTLSNVLQRFQMEKEVNSSRECLTT